MSEIIRLCSATGREHWERRLRGELGGRRWYVSSATGRGMIQQLRDAGIPERTARWLIRGK